MKKYYLTKHENQKQSKKSSSFCTVKEYIEILQNRISRVWEYPEYQKAFEMANGFLHRLPTTTRAEYDLALNSIPKHDAINLACLEAGYNHAGLINVNVGMGAFSDYCFEISKSIHWYAMDTLEGEEFEKWYRLTD